MFPAPSLFKILATNTTLLAYGFVELGCLSCLVDNFIGRVTLRPVCVWRPSDVMPWPLNIAKIALHLVCHHHWEGRCKQTVARKLIREVVRRDDLTRVILDLTSSK